jgi:hypothetical protein
MPDRPIRGICNLFAVENDEGIDLFDDVTRMNSRCWRSTVFHLDALCPEIVRRDLGEPPAFPYREDVTVENRFAHGPGAIRHRRVFEPALTNDSEGFAHRNPTLLALFFLSGRAPLPNSLPCVDPARPS